MKVLKRKILDLVEWIIYKLFTSKQRRMLTNSLTQKHKRMIKRLINRGKVQSQLREIERVKYRLRNLGFTQRALEDLESLYHQSNDLFLKKAAAWELAVWYANQYSDEGARRCLELLPEVVRGEKDLERLRCAAIIEAECYETLGDIEAAKKIISRALELEKHADLFLAAANLESSISARVEWINKALQLYGMSEISLDTSINRPGYDRLISELEKQENASAPNDSPKVSVIIPVYNAEDVIHTSLGSVLAQTWSNLEVFVADDCSTDNTISVVEEYLERDPRVHLIKADSNGGAYVARNLALREASGDFVTVNDADDWSHPRKIEKQVLHLLENPLVIGNTSEQARATDELKFFRRGKPGLYIFSNMSSFMFRREPVMEAIGYWDSVRFGADSEYIKRIKKVFGEQAVVEVPTGPLSFQRQSETSLTGNSAFGFPGYFMGARKEYAEAQDHFHSISDNLYYKFPQKSRPFAIPEPMWPTREAKFSGRRHFDVILVSDFRMDGGSTLSNLEEIKAQKQMGLRTGLIQMSRYDYSPQKRINSKIRNVLDGNQTQMIVYGEKVSCDVLVVRYPPILQEWQRFVPDVKAKEVRVIVNQTPMSDYGPDAVVRYDISRVCQHLQEYFGKPGIWHPIGPLVRQALHDHHSEELKSIVLADEDWSNIINIDEWKRSVRPNNRANVIIGRHSRDQYVKWPADPEELLTIYSDNYEIHVLGGAETPKSILGHLPSNWHVLQFGEMAPKDFLSSLDVFVYYTHRDWIESFGRVIIEAMAVGVPVILPHSYQALFSEAAIYATPSRVAENIERLMKDNDYYKHQVEKARNYIMKHFGYSKHAVRLGRG